MKAAAFEYHAPSSIEEAAALLAEHDDAKVIAGGQSFAPLLNMRLSTVGAVVDIGRIDGLRGVAAVDGGVRIGALTTHAVAGRDPLVAAQVPLLARAVPLIGHFQIRNRGTVGGSVAHADPAAEIPAVLRTLDGTVEAVSPRGTRTISAADFFTGIWATTLEPDEILTAVTFPVWSGRCGFAIEEFARRHGDFAIAGATVAVQVDDTGAVARCAIGLLGLGSVPERAASAEALATAAPSTEVDAHDLGRAAMAGLTAVPSDLNGSARYRMRVGAEMVARAWRRAVEEATRA